MRILMTVSSSSLMDGINRHVLAIAAALNALPDVEVGVVTLHPWAELNDALRRTGVKCWSLECDNGHQLKVIPRFWRLMREFRPDVVHAHVMAYWESVLLRWIFRDVKTVVTVHGVGDPIEKLTLRMRLERVLRFVSLSKMDANVFISAGVKNAFVKNGAAGTVVYNPIVFDPQVARTAKDRKVIGTACRFAGQKNLEAMVRVMIAVAEQDSSVEAWLIGDGPDGDLNGRLRDLVKAARVEDRVKFLGYQRDVLSLVRKMSCFVMTSHWEGMPTSLLEAMSVKTPIVFMVGEGGLHDLAEMNRTEGPFAVVVSPGDEGAMVEGICALLKDPAKAEAYANRAFEVGQRHFDLPVVARQLKEVYEKCLKEG